MNSNDSVRDAWNANAQFWDERMAEGNDFFNVLIWPAVARLLDAKPGHRILDVACGNGLTSRRLAAVGTSVVAVDFSEKLIALAKQKPHASAIDYGTLDATDADALLSLGSSSFDAALCNMAFMDMAEIAPLISALAKLLRPGGRFVVSTLHPCFNNPSAVQMAELEDREGHLETTYSVKISKYRTPYSKLGAAMHDQPTPHPYFHRSLTDLLAPAFAAGFVVDAFEERAFPVEYAGGTTALSWSGHFGEIPPILVVRFTLPA